MRFVLASSSPRRADLLRAAGFDFVVDAAEIDESVRPAEAPAGHVQRLAREKAAVVARRHPDAWVLGADTVVVVDDLILGKPVSDADARRMLGRLQGRVHSVLTGVALCHGAVMVDAVAQSAVAIAEMTDEEIDWYVASGEPRDKAGAYAIQGLASRFVTDISGSYSNVVGLPVAVVHRMMREAGGALSGI